MGFFSAKTIEIRQSADPQGLQGFQSLPFEKYGADKVSHVHYVWGSIFLQLRLLKKKKRKSPGTICTRHFGKQRAQPTGPNPNDQSGQIFIMGCKTQWALISSSNNVPPIRFHFGRCPSTAWGSVSRPRGCATSQVSYIICAFLKKSNANLNWMPAGTKIR